MEHGAYQPGWVRTGDAPSRQRGSASDLTHFKGRVAVAVGAEDTITPPAACEPIAKAANVSVQVIPGAGHAGYIEAPERYSALIEAFSERCVQYKEATQ